MSKYPLAPLLSVREHKEELAQQAVLRAENALVEARKDLQKAEEDCKNYEEWCQQEINRYYSEIIGSLILFKELELLKVKTGILLDNVKEKYKLVDKAKDYVEACIEAKERAIKNLTELKKQTAKLAEHKKLWEAEEKILAQQREEVELEDFKMPEREEEQEDIDE